MKIPEFEIKSKKNLPSSFFTYFHLYKVKEVFVFLPVIKSVFTSMLEDSLSLYFLLLPQSKDKMYFFILAF